MAYLLALDQGTTSSRAIVFDDRARVVSVAQRALPQVFPRPGWVEHDPEAIWSTQRSVMHEAVDGAGVGPDAIAGVGVANQRETTVVWDRATGEPIHNAIVWQDRRTAPACERLRGAGRSSLIRERTGLVPDAYFSATKIAWILDHVRGARARAERGELAFGTVDAWLIWKLTGGERHVTDASNASRTLLYNIRTGAWDDGLLELFGVPRPLLPEVIDSSGVCAHASKAAAGASIPIGGVAGDQQAALFGQACTRPGMAKNTYGTGCFMLMNTGDAPALSDHGLLSTVAWRRAGRTDYALEGAVFTAGALVQWLRDGLGVIERAADVEALAASTPDSAGVYVVPALTGLGAPYWDQHARGAVLGLTRGSTKAHIARAALEGIALQVADVARAMEGDAGVPLAELRVDGGASRNDLLMQIQADVLGAPVVRPRITETTALGAAHLAGLAAGMWTSPDDLIDHAETDRRFEPRAAPGWAEALRAGWAKAVERAGGWAEA